MKSLQHLVAAVSLLALTACHTPLPPVAAPPAQVAGELTQYKPLAADLGVKGSGPSFSIRYLSTNGVTGTGLVPVTGAVIYPAGPAPAGGWPIVAWAHGTVGIADSCAPSRNPRSARDQTYLGEWLHRGFAIVATDYQGLGSDGTHPYLNARTEAYSVLDGVRAALAGLPDLSNNIMIVGQSQGAGAAFASAAYAPEYAQALHIRGVVATGIPYMSPEVIKAVLHAKPQKSESGIDPVVAYALLIGASEAGLNPAFNPEQAFTERAMPEFHAASEICARPLMERIRAEGLTRANTFEPTLVQALSPAFKAMEFPTLKLDVPLFVGIGTTDRDVAPQGQLMLVKDACKAGTLVQAHLYKGQDHSQAVLASMEDSAAFTKAVMSGEPVQAVCKPVAR
ncbi:alpha/beta fold hydrolase [Acetobacter okinawensis]|uniref:alpha/beta hydrolase n=1 Tax=Acetobacter okinawensis TaxID=1076594 RepID=UPI001BA6A615|nr:lipase family protein [Acetobacter okinawensis]MBS0965616.1 alpha/beta fold hydrolase [Acetobacter okinawensis]